MNLWIISVNFENTESTSALIDSLSLINSDSIRVGIADNASSPQSLYKLKQIKEKTKLELDIFTFKKNLYYWPAIKKVINNLKNQIGSYPDWVVVCNNDIIFSDINFFKKLSEINVEKYPIIGPNIINSNGKQLNPFMTLPLSKIEKFYWDLYFLYYPLSVLMLAIRKYLNPFFQRIKSKKIEKSEKVYAVHGSAILFSNYFFSRGGWFDDNFEMYCEELTVAEIAKKLHLPITYFPQLTIFHDEHRSTRNINNRLLFDKAKQSYKYFQSVYLK